MTRNLNNNTLDIMSPSNAQKSRSARQTYIGRDGGIVDADKPSPEKQFILRLPEEILHQIIRYAAAVEGIRHKRSGYNYDLDFLSKLVITCRRLRRHTIPLMHRTLSLNGQATSRHGSKPLRLPLEEPTMSLFQVHCRELRVQIHDESLPANAPFPLLRDLVCHLPNVRKLTVHGGYEGHPKEVLAFIQLALQNMPHVRSLELDREYWGLYLHDVFRHIESSSLQSLHLHGVSRPNGTRKRDCILAEKFQKKGTAAITSISVSDYEEDALATEQLIQWPRALTHFHFGHYYENQFYMDLPLFATWLHPHRETLRSINIGYLSSEGIGLLFNASAFPRLETLTLSRWQIGHHKGRGLPELTYAPDTADHLLAPNLHTFTLDFSIYDQHREDFTDFTDPEENWLRAFARDALARNAKLRTVKIKFTPKDDLADGVHVGGYPWDRMDQLRGEFGPHGLAVEYNQPPLTKEEWLEASKPVERGPEYEAAIEREFALMRRRRRGRDIREFFHAVSDG